jgi:hypothetical protein
VRKLIRGGRWSGSGARGHYQTEARKVGDRTGPLHGSLPTQVSDAPPNPGAKLTPPCSSPSKHNHPSPIQTQPSPSCCQLGATGNIIPLRTLVQPWGPQLPPPPPRARSHPTRSSGRPRAAHAPASRRSSPWAPPKSAHRTPRPAAHGMGKSQGSDNFREVPSRGTRFCVANGGREPRLCNPRAQGPPPARGVHTKVDDHHASPRHRSPLTGPDPVPSPVPGAGPGSVPR